MTTSLEGKDVSLWVETTEQTNYPKLTTDDTVYDLVVVGGGVTGVAAAYQAQMRGLKTALIDKSRLIEWTTGNTTAKLTSQHYLIYNYLIENQGEAVARSYAEANQKGIDMVAMLSKKHQIESEFTPTDAYVYTAKPEKIDDIKREVEAAKSLGIAADYVERIELPLKSAGAIRFSHQAQFHPRKFLLGLAKVFVENGGMIYEQTEATDITPGEVHSITTKQGELRARHILQASGEPFWGNEIFKNRMWTKMSYALALTLKDPSAYPKGMYITTDEPMRTIRSAIYKSRPVLIFGGESHEYSESSFDPELHYKNLIDDAHRSYDVEEILFRWLAGDNMPYDRMPYFGAMPDHPTIYVSTGYRAWGLAWAMSATESIIDDILGSPAAWAKPFGLERLKDAPAENSNLHHSM
ncbi:hypothetical protein B7Y94_00930 [Candidatus Saccharibacteria bacterium 32-49-12]|nr:MAG: hypothetical protein B7Y94_00930 [Candidatus Saccharibacteria bacterium 32-49-12]